MHTVFVRQNPYSTEFEVYVTNGVVVNNLGRAYTYEVDQPRKNGTWQLMLGWYSLYDAEHHDVPVTERALKLADEWAERFQRAGIKSKVANELFHDHYDPPPEVQEKPRKKSRRESVDF